MPLQDYHILCNSTGIIYRISYRFTGIKYYATAYPERAILSVVILNAIIIPLPIPLALKGVAYANWCKRIVKKKLIDLWIRWSDSAVYWNKIN